MVRCSLEIQSILVFKLRNERIAVIRKPSFWLYFMFFTINIGFHLYFNEKAILTSWQYGCTSYMEPGISEAIWESWFTALGSHSEIQIKDMTQILSKLQIYIKHESALFMRHIYQVQKSSIHGRIITNKRKD